MPISFKPMFPSFNSFNAQTLFAIALIALFQVLMLPLAWSQTARVMKVQGQRAIIKLDRPGTLKPGQTVHVGSNDNSSRSSWSSHSSRNQIVGGGASIASQTQNPGSTSVSVFDVSGRYGWNRGDMEYGPIAAVRFTGSSGVSTREFQVGGFFDYNLVENTPGTEWVYGGAATLNYTLLNDTQGSNTASGSNLALTLGGQLKWFPFGNSVAIRGDAYYGHSSRSLRTDSTTSGFYLTGGFYIYF